MNSRKMMSHSKRRGEWAELQFMAKAAKLGLQISKPWSELSRYDLVIGTPGYFVSVQVKSTINRRSEGGYLCKVAPCSTCKPYQPGEFDFLAAYVIAKDAWYIIPAKLVVHAKMSRIRLYPSRPTSKYAPYKEAWDLLRSSRGSDSATPSHSNRR
jgi:PD-(D/E)XK endonuclease